MLQSTIKADHPSAMENSENPNSPKEFIRKTEEPTFSSEGSHISTSSNSFVGQIEKRKNDSSDENSSSPKKSKNNVNYEEECYFSRLCEMALASVRQVINMSDSDIERGINTIIEAFRYSIGNKFSDIDFSKPENLWGYLLRYGPSSAGLIRHRVSSVLDASEVIQNYLFAQKQTIKVLNLGSGPGCDIVGLCSSFHRYVNNKNIQFTLVDSFKGWVSVFNIVEFLLREGSYGNACEFFKNNDVSTNYLRFDLTREASENEEFEKSLKEANIVMLNRVISIIEKHEDRIHIAENIGREMKKGAILIFVDTPYFGERYSSAFLNLKLLQSEKDESNYTFQGPNSKNVYVSRESLAQIYIFLKD